jgi:hypothetical protein
MAFRRILIVLLLLAGCAAPEPSFVQVAPTIPPVPAGAARIYFYRWLEPYETLSLTTAFLNGQPVGVTEPGAVLYRDVAPGEYTIAVQSEGIYGGQFKTVLLRPGETAYARVESLRSWSSCRLRETGCWDTFVVVLVNPALAYAEMRDLRFIRG